MRLLSLVSGAGVLVSLAGCGFGCGSGGTSGGTGGDGSGNGNTGGGIDVGTGGSATGAGGGDTGAGGTASGGTTGAGGAGSGTELFRATFEAQTVGTYTEAMVAADFGSAPAWNDGLDEGRASIVDESGKFLRVTYPANLYGPGDAGVQFIIEFPEAYQELYFAYRVRFGAGFEFVKGGKLPGLVGGTSPTGCSPDPAGFSARNMWRTGGAAVQYVYWPEQPNTCGDDLGYTSGTALSFVPSTWHTVQHRVKMNTDGASDGVMQAWFDGVLAIDDAARVWRVAASPYDGIDALYFSTFFGGGDASWAPTTAQTIDFDDLVVSTGPIP